MIAFSPGEEIGHRQISVRERLGLAPLRGHLVRPAERVERDDRFRIRRRNSESLKERNILLHMAERIRIRPVKIKKLKCIIVVVMLFGIGAQGGASSSFAA